MDYKQRLFPDLTYGTYLNHASISPLNQRCRQAITQLTEDYSRRGVKAWGPGNEARGRLRGLLGQLIGASGDDIALLGNTSQALSIVACEFPWRRGDGLVLVRGEFPGNVLPWLYAARRFDLEVHWLEVADLLEQGPRFEQVMARQPRLLAISWVQYQTGVAQSLDALSRLRGQYGIQICLDAIQGLGPLTMNLAETPLDYVACGGHKWLLSPEGTGFLYVMPKRMAELQPTWVSWISQEDASSFLFLGSGYVDYEAPLKTSARRFETATLNAIGLTGMEASIALMLEVGPAEISRRVLALAERCRRGLAALGLPVVTSSANSGNACVPLAPERLHQCVRALDPHEIIVSTPDGHLRASPHFYNEPADIDHYLERLAPVLG